MSLVSYRFKKAGIVHPKHFHAYAHVLPGFFLNQPYSKKFGREEHEYVSMRLFPLSRYPTSNELSIKKYSASLVARWCSGYVVIEFLFTIFYSKIILPSLKLVILFDSSVIRYVSMHVL